MHCNVYDSGYLFTRQSTQARQPPPLLISVLLGRRVNTDLRMWAEEHITSSAAWL